jgi:VIT1/CCC1 family predicted Fe2+/Mn2+ transporter
MYDAEQVSEILRRAAGMEQAVGTEQPKLSLAELEHIAREAGLDPAAVRLAARELSGQAAGGHRGFIERVLDGELSVDEVGRWGFELREALKEGAVKPPEVSAAGRTVTVVATTRRGVVEAQLSSRDGKTILRLTRDARLASVGAHLLSQVFAVTVGSIAGGLAYAFGAPEAGFVAAAVGGVFGVPAVTYALMRGRLARRSGASQLALERLAETFGARLQQQLAGRN